MRRKINHEKLLTISLLPAMWLIYFLFEIITGRVKDSYTFILNLSLIFVFAFTGWIIYYFSQKYSKGINSKRLFFIFFILMLLDQGIKIIIKFFFFEKYFEIIPNFLSFNPIINSDGSWLNARFGAGVSFPLLIIINILALIIFIEVYRYFLSKGTKNFWSDLCFLFIFCGALCSLIDKVFYGGSLDFIGISNLFVADIKDIYINIGILFFIMCVYTSGYLSDEEDTSLKEDIDGIKRFLSFIKKDLFKI
ncbi:Putative membrane protein [Clostridium chauvoei JF4335]|uniref:Putative membrane protein n=1 Tax=Clostridium chauvoei JF4335 TaxID=1351755 RepID=A0A1U6JRI9_9CLOT|nr:signal peptidase II [Clostridium chauvoei]SLK22904.1 Putative membrane protein [Clostridium chauvoei JF4335]